MTFPDFGEKNLGKAPKFDQLPRPPPKSMVALRLTRQGSKDRPYYKIVAVDSRKRRDGRYIEQLGTYNPMAEGENYTLDLEKADKWLSVGAKPSSTVGSIIKKVRNAG